MTDGRASSSLRDQVISGGVYMALRWGVGTIVSLGGIIALTRLIGPKEFGVYASLLALFMYVRGFASFGLNVFLIRLDGEPDEHTTAVAFTLTLLSSVVVLGILEAALPAIAGFVALPNFRAVASVGLMALPFALMSGISLALLERRLAFRRVSAIELSNQLLFYVVAIPAALVTHTAWAPVGALVLQQAVASVTYTRAADVRLRLAWDAPLAREMLSYGAGMTAAQWIWQIRLLVNPVLVSHFLGAQATGQVALAIRVVETLSFVRTVTWRLSIAALSRLRGRADAMRRAIEEGMALQLLALAPLLLAFVFAGPTVVRHVFGAQWLPMLDVLPFIGIAYLANVMFNMHSSALYVEGRNWAVALFHVLHVALLCAGVAIFVPQWGLRGYGAGEMLALLSYGGLHLAARRVIPRVSYRVAGLWFAAASAGLLVHLVGWYLIAGLGLVFAVSASRRQLGASAAPFLERGAHAVVLVRRRMAVR